MPYVQVQTLEKPVLVNFGERFSPNKLQDAILELKLKSIERNVLLEMVKEGFHAVCEEYSMREIARKIGCSVRTVQRVLSRLLEKFEGIVVKRRRGFVNAYFFTRTFLQKVGAIVLPKKKPEGAAALARSARPPMEKPPVLTNREFDEFRKRFREVGVKLGLSFPRRT
jgi:Homeodomain-like domain